MFSLPARRAVCQGSRFLPSQSVRLTCLTLCLPSSPHISSTIGTLQPPHTRSSSIPRSNHFSTSSIARLGGEPQEEQEMNSGEKSIHDILTKEFQPATLQVQDVSGGCGSFYAIVIASSQFNGKPTVKAHRLVNEALKDVISGIHGLQLRTMPVKS